ncbi:uncharacterized protein M6B38_304540 [Iris pallida]|uniref:Wings apart-like protein C-terminal domain-containing protein n=1 Tax=Iris pallida TaxID=29817 RepID=A0AAX6HLP6_IRIPA|nr:uncharacterized protein M6B38_304540 [Iris pallida]
MIVRTYARRSRCDDHGGGSFSEPLADVEGTDIDDSQEFSLSQGHRPFDFSSQDSDLLLPLPSYAPTPEPAAPAARQSKKRRRGRDAASPTPSAPPAATATLMEAQEFGEMMEHVDEANFALDGLRRGQPARIRRASLLSLLAICGTPQRRRLLRARGMAKRIIDAILALNFDDSPSTVAAAALFFVLASDVQDDHLLDSPPCIQFLIKLLDPKMDDTVEDKAPAIGSKLLGILKPQLVSATNKGMDSSSRKIISKVQEILLDCKEIKSCSQDEDGVGRPELSTKWISLLTMEKACLSTVSFEDTCETVRKVGGNFKERLRELGGLDATFDVIVSCHSTMERWSKHQTPLVPELKDGKSMESVVLLLKCLKIMENATFLSKDNQDHLLNMRGKLNAEGLCPSFVGIVISCIKFLSGLSLLQAPASIANKGNSTCSAESVYTHNHASQSQKNETTRDDQGRILTAEDVIRYGIDDSHVKRSKASHRHQKLADSSSELSVSGSEMTVDVYSSKEKADSHAFEFIDEALSGSNGGSYLNTNGLKLNINPNSLKVNINANGLKVNSGNFGKGSHRWISIRASDQDSNFHGPSKATGSKSKPHRPFKKPHMSQDVNRESIKDSFDPFAFDEDELKPSKWDKVARNKETSQKLQSEVTNKGHADGTINLAKDPSSSQSTNGDSQTLETNFPSIVEETTNLMEDCLLTSVKVLMNLTNDNPEGCQQIAACGGLDTMATLIISHFPSFDLCSPKHSQLKEDIPSSSQSTSGQLNDKHLSDHGLDFLVAILGLLVNLVEKDSGNRLRLASARVFVERPGSSECGKNKRDVIPLLCSIFLANQGAGEAAGEQRLLQCQDDESSLMQGEREAEMMIIEAYAALLLAFLSTESAKVREAIARCLPNHNLQNLVPVLERFVAFHLTLNMISPETHSTVTKVIEACKGP